MTDFTAAWNLIDQPDVWPSSLPAAAEDLPRAAAERFHYLEASTLTNAEEYTPQHLARFVHQTEELLNAFSPGDVRARIEAAARAQEAEETRQGRPVPTSPAAAVLGMEKLAAHAAGMAGAADAAPLAVEDLVQLAASGLRATAAQIERGQPARQPDALDYQETYAHLHTREAEGDLDATLDDLAALLARAKEAQLREGDRGGLAALKEAGAAALGHLEKLTGQDPRELHEEALEGHVYHDEIESRYGLPAPSVAQSVLRAATRIPYARQKEAYRQEKSAEAAEDPYFAEMLRDQVVNEIKSIYFYAEEAVAAHGRLLEPAPEKEKLAAPFPTRAELLARPDVKEAIHAFDHPSDPGNF